MLARGIKADDRNYNSVKGEDLAEIALWMFCSW
jgi:hypothetical protein